MESTKNDFSANLGFAELTEAVASALIRASEAQSKDRYPDHRITAGVVMDPIFRIPPNEDPSKLSKIPPLSYEELSSLKTEGPINGGTIDKLDGFLKMKPPLGKRLAISLSQNLCSTLGTIFELSKEEHSALKVAEIEDSPILAEIPVFFERIGESLESFKIEIFPASSSQKVKRKPKFGFGLECKGGQTGGKGNWSCGGSLKIEF